MKESVEKWLCGQMPGIDEDTLGAIYAEYRESANRLWGELRAVAGGDPAAADRAAHTLKGCAAMVGDTEVFDAVQGWRAAVKAGDAAQAAAFWEKIGPLVEAV